MKPFNEFTNVCFSDQLLLANIRLLAVKICAMVNLEGDQDCFVNTKSLIDRSCFTSE